GFRGELFSRAALKHIHSESRGVPRLVNVICDRSMLGAYTKDSIEIEYPIVLDACKEVLGRDGSRAAAQRSSSLSINISDSNMAWVARLGILLLLIGLAFVMFSTDFLESVLTIFQQSRGKTMAVMSSLSSMLVG
ncbi:MAG TPA: hypothetical protein DHT34_06610, partial [Cellvibrionales bacterium]|nr:hypothetical protein [Cellvibrionales bacterium]